MILIQPLTLYELFSLVNYALVFITLIVSLYLIIRQVRETASQTKSLAASLAASTQQSVTEHIFALDEMFINYPELRPYFYSNKEINEDDTNYDRVVAIAEFVLDLFGTSITLMPSYPEYWPRPVLEEYIKDLFASSPILCRYLNSKSNWYPKELLTLMEAGEGRRQQYNHIKPYNVSRHFLSFSRFFRSKKVVRRL